MRALGWSTIHWIAGTCACRAASRNGVESSQHWSRWVSKPRTPKASPASAARSSEIGGVEVTLGVGRAEEEAGVFLGRAVEFSDARARVVDDPLDRRHLRLPRRLQERRRVEPALVEVGVETQNAEGVARQRRAQL